MNIKRAKQEIKDSIEAYLKKDAYGEYLIPEIHQRPILLMGPPGIGKTQIMGQIARECGVGLVAYTITHHTRQSAIGLPFIREREYDGRKYSVTEYTMSEIIAAVYEKMERTGVREGILFIDEINCVSETLAPTMLQFLQCKTFGNQKLPPGWIIVAAGNPPEYNKSVRDFDIVTLDRIKRMDVEENYEVWKEYAGKAGIHPAILSYLELRRDYFYRMETTVDGRMFATARGWEDLSQLLGAYEKIGKKVDQDVVRQYIQHWKIAKDFANYLELYEKYRKDYGLNRILEGTYGEDSLEKLKFASFDERLSVVGMAVGKLNEMFREWYEEDRCVTKLFEILKAFSRNPDMKILSAGVQEEYEDLRRKELLTRMEDRIFQRVGEKLNRYLLIMQKEHLNGDVAAKRVREEFAKEAGALEQKTERTLCALDHAFDFMEDAFGDGQEMVSFVTELNTNYYSILFLKENDCDKYYKYNKRLLLDERHESIVRRLGELSQPGEVQDDAGNNGRTV